MMSFEVNGNAPQLGHESDLSPISIMRLTDLKCITYYLCVPIELRRRGPDPYE